MSFSVTPDTTVSEAAMFHGALVNLTSSFALASGSWTTVEYNDVEYDTDGFWDAANYCFVIPEGVAYARFGGLVAASDVTGATTVRAHVRNKTSNTFPANCVAENAVLQAAYGTLLSPVIPVTPGHSYEVRARYDTATATSLRGDLGAFPNNFYIEVIKNPFGHPASPTLP